MESFDTNKARHKFETLSLADKQEKIVAVLWLIKWDITELQELYGYAVMIHNKLTDNDCIKLYDIAMTMIELNQSLHDHEKEELVNNLSQQQQHMQTILDQYNQEDEKTHQEADDLLKNI